MKHFHTMRTSPKVVLYSYFTRYERDTFLERIPDNGVQWEARHVIIDMTSIPAILYTYRRLIKNASKRYGTR